MGFGAKPRNSSSKGSRLWRGPLDVIWVFTILILFTCQIGKKVIKFVENKKVKRYVEMDLKLIFMFLFLTMVTFFGGGFK